MKIDNEQINKIIIFAKKQWKPISLLSLIILSLLVTFVIPSRQKNSNINPLPFGKSTQNDSAKKDIDPKAPSNPLAFLFGSKKQEPKSNLTNSQALSSLPNIITPKTSQSTVTYLKPDGTKVTQKVTGTTTINTSQGTINPNANIQGVISSNTQVDNIRIVFKSPDGSTFTYIPPGTPPDEIRWAEYTNHNDKYSLIYPYNWQFFYSIINGHEGIALYPPGVNPSDSKSPYIGFGMSDDFHLPTAGQAQGTYLTQITVDGIAGGLYTNGPIGNSYIASVMPYSENYFGLGVSKSDVTFAYVYYYMINSVNFNTE
jgi:hypothetical protein